MGRRIAVSIDEDVLDVLNAHTRVSTLSRSEIVNVALRRFLRGERRAARLQVNGTEQARAIARGSVPSRRLEGHLLRLPRGPWEN